MTGEDDKSIFSTPVDTGTVERLKESEQQTGNILPLGSCKDVVDTHVASGDGMQICKWLVKEFNWLVELFIPEIKFL